MKSDEDQIRELVTTRRRASGCWLVMPIYSLPRGSLRRDVQPLMFERYTS